MSSTVLITGATGLTGFRILTAILAAGHNARFTARSEEKAQKVFSNPTIRKIRLEDRLSYTIVPDSTARGAFDEAVQGVTHIVHAGSPVPMEGLDPEKDVFVPTVKGTEELLLSALKTHNIKRVVIVSSIVANMAPVPDPKVKITAASRFPFPSPPTKFSNVFEGYIPGKIVALNSTDEFVTIRNPHFTVSHIFPSYVFGRNELIVDQTAATTQNSSNNFLLLSLTSVSIPFPIHGGFVHIDDLAEVTVRAIFLEPKVETSRDFGLFTPVDYGTAFNIIAKAYLKAVGDQVFTRGVLKDFPVPYDDTETKKTFGI